MKSNLSCKFFKRGELGQQCKGSVPQDAVLCPGDGGQKVRI